MDKHTARLIVYLVFLAICIGAFIMRFFRSGLKYIFYELEIYSSWGAMIYYFVMVLMDFVNKALKQKFEKVGKFFSEKVFKYVWIFCLTCGFSFWIGVLLNWMVYSKNDIIDMFLMFFYHLIVQGMLIADLIIFSHSLKTSYLFDIIILPAIYVGYCVLLAVAKFCFSSFSPIYLFMYSDSFGQKIAIAVIVYMVLINMYFLHQFILMKKMKISFASTTVTNKEINDTNEPLV